MIFTPEMQEESFLGAGTVSFIQQIPVVLTYGYAWHRAMLAQDVERWW
jgi:hypothetical protein